MLEERRPNLYAFPVPDLPEVLSLYSPPPAYVCSVHTNPGPFPVPLEMEPHIQHMEVMLGQATRPSPHCASISYGNIMAITFAGTGVSSETERRFFTHLVREGIHVKVESNRTY